MTILYYTNTIAVGRTTLRVVFVSHFLIVNESHTTYVSNGNKCCSENQWTVLRFNEFEILLKRHCYVNASSERFAL